MPAFLRNHDASQSVIDIFEQLYFELRPDRFCTLFKVRLADNGTEFSSPKAIGYDHLGNLRTHIFYCDPSASYSQEDICLMMDHINFYSRESLGLNAPYDVFSFLYGQEILYLLWYHKSPQGRDTQSLHFSQGGQP